MSKSDVIPSSMGYPDKKYDSVAVFSGGLDSTTLVYEMLEQELTPHLLSFNYGQRHRKELFHASGLALKLGLRHDIVDLTGLTHLISNSALTSQLDRKANELIDEMREKQVNIEVPEGHYAEDNMKATVVPNRNMIMLSIAAGVMVNNGYRLIGTGVHAGDHFVYPDCRPQFLAALNGAIVFGNEGFGNIKKLEEMGPTLQGVVYAPFIEQSKADIALKALELGVPIHLTWSCYKGGDMHCGKCGTCVERLEAIDEALSKYNLHRQDAVQDSTYGLPEDIVDPTRYEDNTYWRQAIANAKS